MGQADDQSNVSDIVARQVSAGRGEATAFIAHDATLTYEQLRRQVNRAGHLLRELGVRREQRVLLVLDDTTVFPIVFLGAIRIGAVPVPVSHLDKDDNFRHFVDDSSAEVVVTDAGVLDRLRAAVGDRPVRWLARGRDDAGVTELDAAMAAQPDELDAARTHRDDMAFWLYSSGSTGKPKGVVHLQHDIGVTCAAVRRRGARPGPRRHSLLHHEAVSRLRAGQRPHLPAVVRWDLGADVRAAQAARDPRDAAPPPADGVLQRARAVRPARARPRRRRCPGLRPLLRVGRRAAAPDDRRPLARAFRHRHRRRHRLHRDAAHLLLQPAR